MEHIKFFNKDFIPRLVDTALEKATEMPFITSELSKN
jgi:hypothetical protein